MVSKKIEDPSTSEEDASDDEVMHSSDVMEEAEVDSDVMEEEDSDDVDDDNDEDGEVSDLGEEEQVEEEADDDKEEGKSGWADAMAKVLRAQKDVDAPGKLLLSKAKKDYERSSKPKDDESKKEVLEGNKMSAKMRLKRKELDSIGRVKPTVLNRNREKTFTKLATKGVVQLFNAVRDHQKNLKTQLDQAGKSTLKREKIFKTLDKSEFLNVLSGSKKPSIQRTSRSDVKKIEPKVKEEESETWSVLRDDYMMGAKMKDWDKDSD